MADNRYPKQATETTGTQDVQTVRSAVTTADTAYPSAATDGVAVPAGSRGKAVHVLVDADGTGTTVDVTVALFGYVSSQSQWYAIGKLNSGSAISRTTKTAVADGNSIHYAEWSDRVTVYDRITALVEAATALSTVSIYAIFEKP